MLHSLNLAHRPFRNRALPWTLIAIVGVMSLAWLVYSVSSERGVQAEMRVIERDMTALREQTRRIEIENARRAEAIPPADLQSLQDAHRLIDRKSFSWTVLFSDLEASVPASVRVARISVTDVVQTRMTTIADISLTVVGRSSEDVTAMISTMNQSGVFVATPLTQQNTRTQQTGQSAGVEWTLRLNYTPRAGRVIDNSQARLTEIPAPSVRDSVQANDFVVRGEAR